MGFSLRNMLHEAIAQANPWDGGQTAHTVAQQHPIITPSRPMPVSQPQPQQPQRNILSEIYDQINPFDSGRTFKQATVPVDHAHDSFIHQVTHNGLTNGAGSFVNSVTGIPSIIDAARLGAAELTHNQPAIDNATTSLAKNLPRFMPIGAAEQFKNGFGQDIATAATAPFAEHEAQKQADYARKVLNDHTGDPVHDSSVDAYASAVQTDMLNQHLHTGGVDMNTSLAGDVKHVGGDAVATAANIAMFGRLPGLEGAAVLDEAGNPVLNAAGKVVREAVPLTKTAPVYGGLNATASVADVAANDPNATVGDYLKAGGIGLATGAAFPVAMHGAAVVTPKIISMAADGSVPQIIAQAKDVTSNAAKQTVRAAMPKYNDLTANEIIMNPAHLDTLHNAKQTIATNYGNVPLAQSVITGLHDIKNTYGHDFISGSRADRMQRINQFLEQNGEAIPQYQKALATRENTLAAARNSKQGGYIQIPGAAEDTPVANIIARNTKTPGEFVKQATEAGVDMSKITDPAAFHDQVHREVQLEGEIKKTNPNLNIKPEDSPQEKNITLLNAKQQASKNIQDTGEKMFGSKKDMAKIRTIGSENLAHLESQGERVAANFVTKERVLGGKAKYEVNRSGDPQLEQIKHTLISAIPKRPASSAAARDAFVKFMPKFVDTVKNAGGKEQLVDQVMNEFRRMSYSERAQVKQHFGAKFYNVLNGNSTAIRQALYRPATDFAWAEKKAAPVRQGGADAPQLHGGELVPYDRAGSKPHVSGSPTDIRDGYNFKGLEYGNYVKDSEAQDHLTRFGESMHDIGQTANVHMPDLIKKMNIGIGFGSRGGGKALAHYEPSNKVINITKKSGADGTLGHEFAHAMDDFLGSGKTGRDEYASSGRASNPAVRDAMKNVMKAITEGSTRVTVEAKPGAADGIRWRAIDSYLERHGNSAQAAIDALMKDYPQTKGTILERATQYALSKTGEKSLEVPVKRSPFAAAAEQQGDYWKRPTEMFARVFENYLREKSQAAGIKNNYMAPTEARAGGSALFTPDNMHEITPAIDNLMSVIKQEYGIKDAPTPIKEAVAAKPVEAPAAVPDTHMAYGKTIDMTEANGYHPVQTADGGKIYQKVARTGSNAKDSNLSNTWYDQQGNKLTQAQADAMVSGELKTAAPKVAEPAQPAASEAAAPAPKTETAAPKLSEGDHAKLIQNAEDAYVAEKISAATLEKVRANPAAYADRFLKSATKAAEPKLSIPIYDEATFDKSVGNLRKQIQNINRQAGIEHDANGDAVLTHTPENQAKIDKIHQRIDAYYAAKHQAEGGKVVNDVAAQVAAKPAVKPMSAGDVREYIGQQTKAQDAARKGETGFDKFRNELKTKFVDSLSPIEDTLNRAEKNGAKITEENNIKYQLDRAIRGDTIGAQYIHDNGLAHIIQNVPDTKAFDQYLIAKHAADLEAKGIKTGRNLAADKQLVSQFKDQYEPYAMQIKDYSHKLLDTASNYGLISKELASSLKTKYPNYVPLNRIFGDSELPQFKGTGSGKASISSQSIVKTIKGSERQIESPLSSLVQKSVDVVKEGERNKAAQILTGYKELPGNPFSLRKLAKNETVGTKPVISVLVDGKVQRYETTKEIADAAKSLTKEQLGFVGKILSVPTRVLRLGATGLNPAFAMANVTKDTASAFINSSHPLQASAANPKVFVAAFKAAMNHSSKEYGELVREGAGGTSFDIARDAPKQNVTLIRAERNRTSKVMYNVTHPAALFRAAENTIGRSEEFNRAIQYYGNKQAALREGKTEAQSRIYGADAARNDTVNFARAGDYGRVLNSVLPYLNAGIQGSRTFMRNLKDRPAATTGKLVATVFLPTATVTAWNLSSDERKQAYDDIPEYEKQNNIIIIPPHPVKNDKTGQWNVIKIPVSQEIANLNDVVRNGTESAFKDGSLNPVTVAGNLLGSATSLNTQSFRQVVGQLTPQAIKPGIESLTNTNLFTGNQIVPANQKNLPPKDQVGKYTSGTATELGKYTGLSPEHIDNFIRTSAGGLGQNIVNMTDKGLAAAHVIQPDQVQGKSFGTAIRGRFYGAQGKSPGAIADEHNKQYGGQLQKLPGYQSMSTADKAKALNRLQTDVNKVFIPPSDGTSQSKLSVRQQHLMEGKPDLESYLTTKTASGTSGSGNDALSAQETTSFTNSGKQTMTKGQTTYYKTSSGIKHQATFDYNMGIQSAKVDFALDRFKATGNVDAWQTSAQQKYDLLQKQIDHLNPGSQQADIIKLQKQQADLVDTAQKYSDYGGFTKPKSGRAATSARTKGAYTYNAPKTRNDSLRSLLTAARISSSGSSRKFKAKQVVKVA